MNEQKQAPEHIYIDLRMANGCSDYLLGRDTQNIEYVRADLIAAEKRKVWNEAIEVSRDVINEARTEGPTDLREVRSCVEAALTEARDKESQ